mmetsp:Transcript_14004/g.41066  ORF Transcript_14004/g.41066 Transcript_14004/m.41066 type:complete len:252 (+) Transcript_14004:236-991(+)
MRSAAFCTSRPTMSRSASASSGVSHDARPKLSRWAPSWESASVALASAGAAVLLLLPGSKSGAGSRVFLPPADSTAAATTDPSMCPPPAAAVDFLWLPLVSDAASAGSEPKTMGMSAGAWSRPSPSPASAPRAGCPGCPSAMTVLGWLVGSGGRGGCGMATAMAASCGGTCPDAAAGGDIGRCDGEWGAWCGEMAPGGQCGRPWKRCMGCMGSWKVGNPPRGAMPGGGMKYGGGMNAGCIGAIPRPTATPW